MIYRLAGSHATVILLTIAVMIGSAGIMTQQVQFLLAHHQLNFIPSEVNLEGSIAILIASFGVFLEHRRYLLDRIFADGVPATVDAFDRHAHHVGVMFILIAITMEAVDMLFLALNNWRFDTVGLKYVEISILFIINSLAFVYFAMFLARGYRDTARAAA